MFDSAFDSHPTDEVRIEIDIYLRLKFLFREIEKIVGTKRGFAHRITKNHWHHHIGHRSDGMIVFMKVA